MYSQAFIRAKNFTLSAKVEGGLSMDPEDSGNWTGGEKGKGDLLGTKYGISAAQYPSMDIPLLRFDDAVAIYERDYWQKIKGDILPPRLALVVFDSAVNQGVPTAIKLLQSVLGVQVDGIIGDHTLGAARSREQDDLVVEFTAARLLRYSKTKDFEKYGKGWFIRACAGLMVASR